MEMEGSRITAKVGGVGGEKERSSGPKRRRD